VLIMIRKTGIKLYII